MTHYQKANTDWLASCCLGLSTHWTAQTMPRHGSAHGFQEAVDRFRLADFLAAVERSRATHVMFTVTHALQMLACPHPVVDELLRGRTSQCDLLGEMARGRSALP